MIKGIISKNISINDKICVNLLPYYLAIIGQINVIIKHRSFQNQAQMNWIGCSDEQLSRERGNLGSTVYFPEEWLWKRALGLSPNYFTNGRWCYLLDMRPSLYLACICVMESADLSWVYMGMHMPDGVSWLNIPDGVSWLILSLYWHAYAWWSQLTYPEFMLVCICMMESADLPWVYIGMPMHAGVSWQILNLYWHDGVSWLAMSLYWHAYAWWSQLTNPEFMWACICMMESAK